MKNFPWVLALMMVMFDTGESLTCDYCPLSVTKKCWFSFSKQCQDSQPFCFSENLTFNSSMLGFQSKGCTAASSCNRTQTGSFLISDYTVTTTCCSSDRCNTATSLQTSLPAALGVVLPTAWSLWIL